MGAGRFGPALILLGWSGASAVALVGKGRIAWSSGVLAWLFLGGDLLASALAVSVSGGSASPAAVLLALPALEAGLLLGIGWGLLFGLAAALSHALMARQGGPTPVWAAVAAHSFFFTSIGLASGFLGARMQRSLSRAAKACAELESIRLGTDLVMENLPCGVVAADPGGRIRIANREARRILGIGTRFVGMHIGSLAGEPGSAGEVLEILSLALEGRQEPGRELQIEGLNRRGKRVPVWLRTVRLESGGAGVGAVALFWDLTERKALEEKARRSERLAAIGLLAGGLAHEIRNSLKPITGSIEMLSAVEGLPELVHPILDLITREAASLEVFLNQFLFLARDKGLNLEEVDLEQLIREQLQALTASGPWNTRHAQLRSVGTTLVRGDPEWLKPLFRNLLLNAFEAASDSSVRVEIRPHRERSEWITVAISDTGPGLGDLDPEEAFQPFRTLKPGGTGLGLAISKRAAEEHGGRVYFDEGYREGARVVVELPVGGPQAALEAA